MLLLCMLLLACKREEKPPISVDTMKAILLDLHLAEAYSAVMVRDSTQKARYNKQIDSLALFYKQILQRNKVTPDAFEKALEWYAVHPDKLDSVYTKITPVLDSMKVRITASE